MNASEKNYVIRQAFKGGSSSGTLAAAGSIVSGVGLASVPITTCFGLITIGTATVVALPVVLGCATAGLAIGAAAGAYRAYSEVRDVNNALGGSK